MAKNRLFGYCAPWSVRPGDEMRFMISAEGVTTSDPTIGPRTVPAPPTTAGRRMSMLTTRSKTTSGRMLLKYIPQNAPTQAVKNALTTNAATLYR